MVTPHDVQQHKPKAKNNIMLNIDVVLNVLDFLPFIQVKNGFSQVYKI
jgi:hypothetical protein